MEKTYYISKEEYLALKATWSKTQCHSAEEIVIYNVLRGKPASNGFCPRSWGPESKKWEAFDHAKNIAASGLVYSSYWSRVSHCWEKRTDEEIRKMFTEKWGIELKNPLELSAMIKESNHD